jgi:hypothetical protein
MNFKSTLRLSPEQYFSVKQKKTGICLHHTVGGSAASSIDWWKRDNQMVGTAYIIDRDGSVYQAFEPEGWAYQFGLKWPQQDKLAFERRFIGIEIASEGGLIESGGNLYCFDKVSPKTLKSKNEAFDFGRPYRGYRYFDKYESAQIDSAVQLVNYLLSTFNIEKKIPARYMEFYGQKLKNFNGVIGHVNVREDKSDPLPDENFWKRIINECGLQLTEINGSANVLAAENNKPALSQDQVQALFLENVKQFNSMNTAAGSMVKGLLWELQDSGRNTYIRLRDAVRDGHVVFYDLVQGDAGLVEMAAKSLGFKSCDSNRLEVYNA